VDLAGGRVVRWTLHRPEEPQPAPGLAAE
jgi:hypothetical protein